MSQSCSISMNLINAPWLDKPTKIAESELDLLEENYQDMLTTIRNDTFGGMMPPKYNINDMAVDNNLSFELAPRMQPKRNKNVSHINIFNDASDDDNNNNLLLRHELFESAEINQSVERVRMQLNMSAASPSLSPIHASTNTSTININLNEIKIDHEDDNKNNINASVNTTHNLSLPFISPSSMNNTADMTFISQSISPPIFNNVSSRRRTQSEQPQNMYSNNTSSSLFSSVPPRSLSTAITDAVPPQIPIALMQLNQTGPQLFGISDSVTSAMMVTPSNNSQLSGYMNSSNRATFEINNASQRGVVSMRNNRNRHRMIGVNNNNGMVSVINDVFNDSSHGIHMHGIQHDMGSDPIESSLGVRVGDDDSTPVNIQSRSHSVSLDAPRPHRRNQNRIAVRDNNNVSSVELDLTASNNIHL